MPPLYLLHPAAVHFPIALLIGGLAAAALRQACGGPAWLSPASDWALWLGTLPAFGAAVLGWLAKRTAPHVPSAWETLAEHQELA